MKKRKVYLDNAAATPVDKRVIAAMLPYFEDYFYNPSGQYLEAINVNKVIEEKRSQIASLLGVKAKEIIFTGSATEANNLAIHGVMGYYDDGQIITTSIEHPSVSEPSASYRKQEIRVNKNAQVDLANLESSIGDETVLISCIMANNEVGSIQPIQKIAGIIDKIRVSRQNKGINRPIFLHTDASQAANYLSLNLSRLGVDLATISSSKTYGPRGAAALYINRNVRVKPQTKGGQQEFGFRSGTENTAGIVGFAKAFELAQSIKADEVTRLQELKQYFIEGLAPLAKMNSPNKKTLPNIVNASFMGCDAERLIMELDEQGIMASTQAACQASKHNLSTTLTAMGLDEQTINSSVRFSLGRSTKKTDIDYVLTVLNSIIKSN